MITLRARKNQLLKLTEEQQDILIGCILGDAYIEKKGKIQLEQGISQEKYIQWKYQKLQSISYGPPKKVLHHDKRNGKTTVAYRFWTRQFFREWRERFYKNEKKVFPADLISLSPLSMAVWYMDDGCLAEHRRIILSTDGFDQESLDRIRQLFLRCFDVKSTVKATGKLLIGTRETRKLMARIRPYIVPSMAYKIL